LVSEAIAQIPKVNAIPIKRAAARFRKFFISLFR